MNFFVIFLPSDIRHSLPVIIISTTGFVRFVLLPIVMKQENIIIENSWSYMVMGTELLVSYMTIFIFSIYKYNFFKHGVRKLGDNNIPQSVCFWGFSTVIILILGSFYVFFFQHNILYNYVALSSDSVKYSFKSGYESIFVTIYFLLLYCFILDVIKKIVPYNFVGLILMIVISIFFINGRAVQAENVSRTNIILSSIVCFTYISTAYPKYKKLLISLVIVAIVFSATIGSMMKVELAGGTPYQSIETTLKTHLSFKSLNSHFAGPLNYEYFFQILTNGRLDQIPRWRILVSDIFANFPLLNKIFSNIAEQSTTIFNYQIYKSDIARDQVVPFACQFYIYSNIFFVIPIAFIVWLGLTCSCTIKHEHNRLKQFCLIYLSYACSQINTTSFSVMLQHVWVSVLPVFIVYKINFKYCHKTKLFEGRN